MGLNSGQAVQQIVMEKAQPAGGVATIEVGTIHDANNPHSCGYCNSPTGAYSYGFTAEKLPGEYYQQLMSRGWRRCGTYYYKHNLEYTCCPPFSIKVNANGFRIKRHQKKTVRQIVNLVGVRKIKNDKSHLKVSQKQPKITQTPSKTQNLKKPMVTEEDQKEIESLTKLIKKANLLLTQELATLKDLLSEKPSGELNLEVEGGIRIFVSDDSRKGHFYSNYPMLLYGYNKKAFKDLSLHQFSQQLSPRVVQVLSQLNPSYEYSIQYSGYLVFTSTKELVKPKRSEEFEVITAKTSNERRPLKKQESSQQFIQIKFSPKRSQHHNAINKPQFRESLDAIQEEILEWPQLIMTSEKIIFGKLEVEIVPVEQTIESLTLYSKYTKSIHDKTKDSMSSYAQFLCKDAILHSTSSKEIDKQEYRAAWDEKGEHKPPIIAGGQIRKTEGCFHMKYMLEGRLIAVGVVDIVKNGLSSVYFFYDPSYKKYRLGVLSSLLEIEYVRYISKAFPQFQNYYLGYYIHNSQKMNYKADYQPCELLCPASLNYVTVTKQIRDKLDKIVEKKGPTRLSPEDDPPNNCLAVQGDIGVFIDQNLSLSFKNKVIKLKDLQMQYFLPILVVLKVFVQQAGPDLFLKTKFQL